MALREVAEVHDQYIRYHTLLGSGSYKSVYRGFDTRRGLEGENLLAGITGCWVEFTCTVAWNQVKVGRLSAVEKRKFADEVRLLQQLRHKNLIECYDHWEDERKNEVGGKCMWS